MAKFPVKIIQTYKARREITVFVEAEHVGDAMRKVANDDAETPPFEDPLWITLWDLLDEGYEAGDRA